MGSALGRRSKTQAFSDHPDGRESSATRCSRRDGTQRKATSLRIGFDFRRAIQETWFSAKNALFEATNVNVAVDSPGRYESAVEKRLAALNDIEFTVRQQRYGQSQGCARVAVSIPIVDRWVVDLCR